MKLSVVIRCRNEAKSLRHVFDALKAQRCSFEWEIIVVDNESEDNTREVCRESGARVVSLPRHEFTYGRATNVGISHAGGELILLISAHAIPIGSYFLESAITPFSDSEMAATRCLWLGSAKDIIGRWHQPRDIQYKSPQEQKAAESGTKWLGEYPTAGCCVLRRSVWEQVKFDETLEANEDKFWASEVLARGYKMRSCSEAMWVYMRNYSPRDRWRKDNREQLAFYRMTGRAPMSWPKFLAESARALLTAPSIAFLYAVGKIVWNAHLVTIPWQARRKAKPGSLPEFERHPVPSPSHQ